MVDEDVIWRALAKSHRREILGLVRDQERTAGEIAAAFDITRPAVSQHLSALKEAGLLAERRDGTKRLYRARPSELRRVTKWLRGMGVDVDPKAAAPTPVVRARATPTPRPQRAEHEVTLDVRASSAWRVLAEPELRSRWKAAPEPEVLEMERGERIRWRWRFRAQDGAAEVQVQLIGHGRATELRVVHEGPGAELWERYLERLQAVSRGWDPGPEE